MTLPTLRRADVAIVVAAWVAVTLVTIGVIAVAGGVQRVSYVMAVTALAVVVWFAVRHVAKAVETSRWPVAPGRRVTVLPERPQPTVDSRTMYIESNLRRGVDDVEAFNHRVQHDLRVLAEHRLRRAHGVDLDEAAAREALGADLWELLHEPRTRRVAMVRLADAVDRIERIT